KKKTHASLICCMADLICCCNKPQFTVFLHSFSEFLKMESTGKHQHNLMLIIRLKFFRNLLICGSCLIFSYLAVHCDFTHTRRHLSPPFTPGNILATFATL